MPPKRKASSSPSGSDSEGEDILSTDPPTSIDPYATLSIPNTATPQEITRAYRLAALKHHPDKAPSPSDRDLYTQKFQAIAFAYAVLSDPRRRARYDCTGNTSESLDLDDDTFDWSSYFRDRYSETLTADAIEKFKTEYQGSDEERADVLAAYTRCHGDLDAVFESIMCSDINEDEDRFRKIIDDAIAAGDVKKEKKYTRPLSAKDQNAKREKRKRAAEAEAREAEELAEELGVKDKLYNKKSNKKGGGEEDALKALIQSRQKDRQGKQDDFFARLEEKYGGGEWKKTKKSKRDPVVEDDDEDDGDGPSEDAFRAMQARMEKNRAAAGGAGGGKKGKGRR